jgi:hypothetical protein
LEERIKGSFPNCINRKIREINSSTLELWQCYFVPQVRECLCGELFCNQWAART